MFEKLPERPVMLNEKKKRSTFSIVLSVLCSVLFGILLIVLLLFTGFNFWVNKNCFVVEVSGDSMLNTVESGDLLYVRDVKAKRGDIVIISVKNYTLDGGFHFSGEYIIKRLIAVEGDTVQCEDGVLSVKYKDSNQFITLDEPYIRGTTPDLESAVTVGEGEIFFLGDNREFSYDSTEFGCLLEKDIVGVVPDWSLKVKTFTTVWERMRTKLSVHQ